LQANSVSSALLLKEIDPVFVLPLDFGIGNLHNFAQHIFGTLIPFKIAHCIVKLNFKIFKKSFWAVTEAALLGCCTEECLKLEIKELESTVSKFV
jgi:hypothetical protein